MPKTRCYTVNIDGTMVSLRMGRVPTKEDIEAARQIMEAAKQMGKMQPPPSIGQEAHQNDDHNLRDLRKAVSTAKG